ncbi:TlpA family protein disulfide reductase [Sediminitomix flava]|uniref:Thioredoxin-like protein n=1 Tax=Sediminitomix flava TaxID=379075 RepID=A0A315Z6I5_SEDFL|nr:TlpA disulfide reductase family protein [Sediminitomix flava]PWJ37877.1 thioredoxin-like protein [Sediminitomix flava]
MRYFLLFVIFCSCSLKESERTQKLKNTDNTVFVFHDAKYDSHVQLEKNGGRLGSVLPLGLVLYKDQKQNDFKSFIPNQTVDTLVIDSRNDEFLEIIHRYKAIEDIHFLIKAGDTVNIFYDSIGYPVLESSISDDFTKLYNFRKDIRTTIEVNTHLFEPQTILKSEYNTAKYYLYKESKEKYHSIFENKAFYDVDTLVRQHQSFKEKYFKALQTTSLEQSNRSLVYQEYFKQILKLDTYYIRLMHNSRLDQGLTARDIYPIFNDSLIDYPSYNQFFQLYLAIIEYKRDNIVHIRKSNSITPHYRQVFENLRLNDSIPEKTKCLLSRILINDMVEDKNADLFRTLAEHKEMFSDSTFLTEFEEKNRLTESENTILLESPDGEIIDFFNLLKNGKEDEYYIEYWATWCKPCIKEFPYLKGLAEKLANENKKVIALSLDEESGKWKDFLRQKDFIDKEILHFRVYNQFSSKKLKSYQIESIPKNMEFFKNGNIKTLNAQRPSQILTVK